MFRDTQHLLTLTWWESLGAHLLWRVTQSESLLKTDSGNECGSLTHLWVKGRQTDRVRQTD